MWNVPKVCIRVGTGENLAGLTQNMRGGGMVINKIKNSPLAIDAKLLLVVAKEVAKVNVEDLTLLIHHDVVRVSATGNKYRNQCFGSEFNNFGSGSSN